MNDKCQFRRILLKLSGEALKGDSSTPYSEDAIKAIVERVRIILAEGVEVAIVVGAGNLWRGATRGSGMDRVNADYMGMLGTVMNALNLKEHFNMAGIPAMVQCSVNMEPIARKFNREDAVKALESGQVVIFGGGAGSPYFTTDTTSVLRALETGCDAVIKATKVDGVYSADPKKDPTAVRYAELSFDQALAQHLKILDSTAFTMCRDNDLPIIVFDFNDTDAFRRVLRGDTAAGTIIS